MSLWSLELGYWIASRDTEVILKIFISRFSAAFFYNLQLLSFNFLVIFELIDLPGPMNIFEVFRYNTGPILEAKFGFEHIFEIGIFKRRKFCLRFKSFKSFSNEYVFV